MTNNQLNELLEWATNYNCPYKSAKLSDHETVIDCNRFIDSHVIVIDEMRKNINSQTLKMCVLRLLNFRKIVENK